MIDVLNLEWTSYPSRDRNVASLVCNYLRLQGYDVLEESIFNGYYLLEKYKPKVLFMTNTTGAPINFEICKYANLRGVKVVSLISEGNFKDDIKMIDVFLWGHNKEHKLYEKVNLQWSVRTQNLTLSAYPNLKGRIKTCGSCGADTFKIWNKTSKKTFLNKYNKGGYKKIIGIGCWDFGICYENGREYEYSLETYGLESIERFQRDRDDFNKILIQLIENNPEILFLVKEHPGNTAGAYMSGAAEIEKYSNVLLLKFESIVDCISVSDIWVTYESTTVFEAWMAEKQTCLLDPSGIDFPRANVYKGSPNYPTFEQFQEAINAFYKTGQLPGFEEKKEERQELIKCTIQWDDGLNHVRAGNEIIRLLGEKNKEKKRLIPFNLQKKALKYTLKNFLPGKKTFFFADRKPFNNEEVKKYSKELYDLQLCFYEKRGLSKEELSQIKVIG